MLSAAGRVVMISGANRGIGLEIAKKLVSDGYFLSLGVRDPKSLDLGVKDPPKVLISPLDVTDPVSCEQWVAATVKKFSRIDGLVNNAGIYLDYVPEEGKDEDLEKMWQVNCMGPARLTRMCLPHLRKSGVGRVVNIASLSGKRVSSPKTTGYCMTKHALMALTHGTRKSAFDDGVRATAICPGLTKTDMSAQVVGTDGEITMTLPEDVAALVSLALSLPNRASVTELAVNCRAEDLI